MRTVAELCALVFASLSSGVMESDGVFAVRISFPWTERRICLECGAVKVTGSGAASRGSRSRQGLDDQPRAADGDGVFNQSGGQIFFERRGQARTERVSAEGADDRARDAGEEPAD